MTIPSQANGFEAGSADEAATLSKTGREIEIMSAQRNRVRHPTLPLARRP